MTLWFTTLLPVHPLSLCQAKIGFLCNENDVIIGGSLEDILHDLNVINKIKVLDLTLNKNKSEIICDDTSINHPLCYSWCQVIPLEKATLIVVLFFR